VTLAGASAPWPARSLAIRGTRRFGARGCRPRSRLRQGDLPAGGGGSP
jgi:hypothetical protein